MIALVALSAACAKGVSSNSVPGADGGRDGGQVDGGSCDGGACCRTDDDCSDGVGCTRDECSRMTGQCQYIPLDTECPEGTVCRLGMGCAMPATCEFDSDCGDESFCNGLESCVGGVCRSAGPRDCDDGDSCTVDECVEADGECANMRADHNTDPLACGATGADDCVVCPSPPATAVNQVAACEGGVCGLTCEDGYSDSDGNPVNGCECMSGGTGTDRPDLMFLDVNCDGIDGEVAIGVFVDGASGSDTNPGTMISPLKTIQAAIDQAASDRFDVYVSEGSYMETLSLADGVSVFGGYRADQGWARSSDAVVEIAGGTEAVTGSGVRNLELQLLTIRSSNATTPGGSSIALRFARSSDITLRALDVTAGAGASGMDGTAGMSGGAGSSGAGGRAGCEESGLFCANCSRPLGGAGGGSSCGRLGGKGGDSGRSNGGGTAGAVGIVGTTGGRGGASRGDGVAGSNGTPGAAGSNGMAGANFGMLSESGYAGAAGGSGTTGDHGNGGGGGGGGGGGTNGCDSYGSSGGGGGGGGCGGTTGMGGTGGGASIALALWSTVAAVSDTDFHTGPGGTGGSGGDGGAGGAGGSGGNGGPYGGSGEQDDGGDGARGGNGGNGGNGGHGGGGGGGPAIGVACGGTSGLSTDAGNTFDVGAAGGGGTSRGNAGQRGVQVDRQGC